jgi:CMP-N-acetylneuraminic acid synthetase
MKVLGITLARGGSKGVPRKNIREINGVPLLAYTIKEALLSKYINYYVVSTEDEDIAKIAEEYGAYVIDRPDYLASDSTPSIDALQHALFVAENNWGVFDIVADLRCTNPLKKVEDIDGAIEKLIKTGADVVCGVSKLEDHHPSRIKRIFQDRLIDFAWPEDARGQRQDLKPDAYIRNGSIYIVRARALEEGIHFTGTDEVRPWIMPLERSVNVDTELDFKLLEAMLE